MVKNACLEAVYGCLMAKSACLGAMRGSLAVMDASLRVKSGSLGVMDGSLKVIYFQIFYASTSLRIRCISSLSSSFISLNSVFSVTKVMAFFNLFKTGSARLTLN